MTIIFPTFLLLLTALINAYAQKTVDDALDAHRGSSKPFPKPQPPPNVAEDYNLLDILLVASVDGKFHALSRKTGQALWSMSSAAGNNGTELAALAPLVQTVHKDVDPDLVDDPSDGNAHIHETYIIEPQSGDIYVSNSPGSPLVRFPLSVAALVDLSPFSLSDTDERMFVGRKETTLMLMELETGKIKLTLNSKCPVVEETTNSSIDLDELENSELPISAPTEIYIGRTDYHITIFKGTTAYQELSFSSYGPNNKDTRLQATYTRTNDGVYLMSMPNGEVISFKAASQTTKLSEGVKAGEPLWGHKFPAPIVAVFDILAPAPGAGAKESKPFALLQPTPKLTELFPNLHVASMKSSLPDGSAFVGLTKESGSLFVMGPERYPLVVFGGADRGIGGIKSKRARKLIGPPSDKYTATPDTDVATSVDEITRRRKAEEDLEVSCQANPYHHRCLVGLRKVDAGDGHEGRFQRLLDGPTSEPQTSTAQAGAVSAVPWSATEEPSRSRVVALPSVAAPQDNLSRPIPTAALASAYNRSPSSGITTTKLEAALITILVLLLSFMLFWDRLKARTWERWNYLLEMAKVRVGGEMIAEPGKAEMTPLPLLTNGTPEPSVSNVPPPLSLGDEIKDEVTDAPLPSNNPPPVEDPMVELVAGDASLQVSALTGDEGDETEADRDADTGTPTPGKKKARRGQRGKGAKGKKKVTIVDPLEAKDIEDKSADSTAPSSTLVVTSSPKPAAAPSLIVSDTVLGRGSHGTVVLQGSLQGRAVAVKRLLQDFVTLAAREVSILQESDDHPNVIRYYYQEAQGNFLYIALELCVASLGDIVEQPNRDAWRDIAISFDPKKALRQITSGLRHLHGLKLIHRDIKPQNILISSSRGSTGAASASRNGKLAYRMLISDFGLCKKLEMDQTSFLPTAHGPMAAGSVGWRAPEILRGDVNLEEMPNGEDSHGSFSSRGSANTILGNGNGTTTGRTRLTKSVDIFALGCLYYYTLTNGSHPFGDRIEREVNIMKNVKDLSLLDRFGEEGTEAQDLISAMLNTEAKQRPDTLDCLLHPFYWDSGRRLNFLQDASDRFEILCRDPKDQHLITLENESSKVIGSDWYTRLDKAVIENLGKYRKYDGKLVQDLLRALRNKKHHYQDIPDNVKRIFGSIPDGYLAYFTRRYPQLILHVHQVIRETGFSDESMFRPYFELAE